MILLIVLFQHTIWIGRIRQCKNPVLNRTFWFDSQGLIADAKQYFTLKMKFIWVLIYFPGRLSRFKGKAEKTPDKKNDSASFLLQPLLPIFSFILVKISKSIFWKLKFNVIADMLACVIWSIGWHFGYCIRKTGCFMDYSNIPYGFGFFQI